MPLLACRIGHCRKPSSGHLQPEIELRATTCPGLISSRPSESGSTWVGLRTRFFPQARPGAGWPRPTSDPVDEFSDLPPEFSDDHIRVEMPGRPPAGTDQVATPRPVAGDGADTCQTGHTTDSGNRPGPDATAVCDRAAQTRGRRRLGTGSVLAAEEATSVASGSGRRPRSGRPRQCLNDQRISDHARPVEGGAQAADMAWSLLEIISLSNDTTQPQERALAADALLNLLPKLTARILMSIADRMSLMEAPPRLIVNQLVRDHRPEIAGPLARKSAPESAIRISWKYPPAVTFRAFA